MKVCLISSSGGHLEQLMMLKPLMEKYDYFVVTEKTKYTSSIEKNSNMYFLPQINRKEFGFIFKFFISIIKSLFIFLKFKPDLIISTGALCSIPMCLIGKIFNKKVIFVESFAKINSPTLTGKFIYKFADLFIIQWKSLEKYYPDAIYGGGIY